MLGIELNPYAAELARVSVWIGEIQWMRANGYEAGRDPILRPLDTIECRDAILNPDGTRADWPAADVVIGNPPFLGGKLMRDSLGDDYVERPRSALCGARVRPGRSRHATGSRRRGEQIAHGASLRAGLVATNSIRGGANRAVLNARSSATSRIFDAWDDEPWVLDGAAVRVSLVCFDWRGDGTPRASTASTVEEIYTDLTARHRRARSI